MRLKRNIAGKVRRASDYSKPVVRPKTNKPSFVSKGLNILSIAAAISILTFSMLLTGAPKVEVNSTAYRSVPTYLAAIKHDDNVFHKTKLTFDGQILALSLKKQFPEVISANVKLPLFSRSPTIVLRISPPSFIIKSNSSSYLIDREGTAVLSTTNFKTTYSSKLRTIVDQSGLSLSPGTRVLSPSEVIFIREIIAQSSVAKVPISSLTLPPLSQELDIRTSDQPYFTKFYLGGDPSLQSGQFLAARHNFAKKNVHPSKYLDVRIPGKIFFK